MILNSKALSTIPKEEFPIYADGTYYCKVKDISFSTTNAGGKLLKIQLIPAGDTLPLRNGGEVKNNGRIIFDQISMTATENWDPDVKIAEMARAVKFDGEDIQTSDLVNKWVKIKLGYKAAKGDYPEGNSVKKYYPIEESDGFNVPQE